MIDVVDAATGAVKSTLTLTGPAAGIGGWDGAAMRPDGKLIIGSQYSTKIFTVDTASGASAEFFDYRTLGADYTVSYTTGDFVTLDNGDEIALATWDDSGDTTHVVVRISSSGAGIVVGGVAEAWGAGRVDDNLMLAGADGVIRKIALADLPTTASTATLTEATVVDSGVAESLWGAAGTRDSGTQVCALPDTGISSGTALTVGLIGAGLGLAGAASILIARRKRA